MMKIITIIKSAAILGVTLFMIASVQAKVIVALDPGHGGKDSGAVGPTNLYEKNVTLSIANKVVTLLNKDSQFKAVLTRTSDRFISVSERSNIARDHKANLLISIHADAAPDRSADGASVWVLSTKRADTELGRWLEQGEKQSELLGGAGEALSEKRDPNLSQAILDLQFSNSQRVGYELAVQIIKEMRKVATLHKNRPEHASLGVLRSPDIPSILIEVGFISNRSEESLLSSQDHQNKLAQAIYQGIKNYVKQNPTIAGAP